ncbi:DUF1827 family protein [Vagococcus xieshaowenii]|uniref:DUF1827 family protein n=1 Tax=Vagococcus xieshaowenii TaxID=2562451 RepID=A0AAJ5EF25_9ENTE|nr:DUF1827 family protein [Vagococcus xieshaowenii]QCA28304.1 DUF1827 family protein [Vagococcus xieshaowenii]TFZ42308.1 DUF1827 family protein [Vagococcus xieshaowenii]
MKLIDVTNSYAKLVNSQLSNTDSLLVKVYTLGKTNIIYSEARKHKEVVIQNKQRKIKDNEIEFVLDRLVPNHETIEKLDMIRTDKLVEITFPL